MKLNVNKIVIGMYIIRLLGMVAAIAGFVQLGAPAESHAALWGGLIAVLSADLIKIVALATGQKENSQ